MEIRTATVADLHGIVEIYNQAIRKGKITGDLETYSALDKEAWLHKMIGKQPSILVAVEADEVVGYAHLAPYRPGRQAFNKTAEISYYVHDGHLRKRIGSNLLDGLITMARTNGFLALLAILIDTNVASIKLLEKRNFKNWGFLPNIGQVNGEYINHIYFGLHLD